MNEASLLDISGAVSVYDRQRHLDFQFPVDTGTAVIQVEFSYNPGMVGGLRNLLTLALYDSRGVMRGAAHRWAPDQRISLSATSASPGFVPGRITPGVWRAVIDLHEVMNTGESGDWCQYSLRVLARSGEIPPTRDESSTPPVRLGGKGGGPGWYGGDLHAHTVHCDGLSSIVDMGRAAAGRGLDFLAITGHNTTSSIPSPPDWPEEVVHIRGIELTTFIGHANVLGVDRWIEWRVPGRPGIERAQHEARAARGVFVINHPTAIGNPLCTGCRWDAIDTDFALVDALEVWNGPWANRESKNEDTIEFWNGLLLRGIRILAVGGGDAHSEHMLSHDSMPITYIHAQSCDEQALLEGVRRGNVVITTGPLLRFMANDEVILPGEVCHDEAVSVIVSDLSTNSRLTQIVDGEEVRRVDLAPPGGTVSFDLTAAASWSRWELRAIRHPGEMLTITNPLFRTQYGCGETPDR